MSAKPSSVIHRRLSPTQRPGLKITVFPAVLLLAIGLASNSPASVTPERMRCEYLINPLGIDTPKPRLSWILADCGQTTESRGLKQTAYQVLVASTLELLAKNQGDLWDSGKVMSDATSQIEYGGKPLPSRQQCFWKVKTWLSNGISSESNPASWEMGLLKPDDWKAKWVEGAGDAEKNEAALPTSLKILRAVYGSKEKEVDVTAILTSLLKNNSLELRANNAAFGGDPSYLKVKQLTVDFELGGKLFQKTVTEGDTLSIPDSASTDHLYYLRKTLKLADKPVAKARLFVTALGLYEAHLNGQRVGDVIFGPEWTDYNKRIRYQEYDVTSLLQKGENVLAGLVGHGWYSGTIGNGNNRYWGKIPALFMQLEITYADGTVDCVVTDGSWKATESPIVSSDFMLGENYDARLAIKGWAAPGLDESAWRPVNVREEAPRPLESQVSEPVRQVGEIKPRNITEPKPGSWTFDLGQNMVGFVRLKVSAPAGTKVTLRHAEMLNPDGTIYTKNLRTAISTDTYICKGDGVEVFQPHFTFHGFRYVEVTGLTEKPSLDTVAGVVVATDTPRVGEFACSDPRINQLYSNILWGQRGNYLSIPTDCPQRNERLGWMGDAQVFVRTATCNADVAAFFSKWLVDVDDAQHPNGAFSDVSPSVTNGQGTPAWGDAGVSCPWTIYQGYGDLRQLEQHYPAMVRWIEYCRANSDGLIRPNRGYGDWLSIGADTPKELIGTAYFAYSTQLVAQAAKVLGKMEDATKYEQLFQDIKAAFNKKYVAADGRMQATVQIKNKDNDQIETVTQGNTQCCYVMALRFGLLSDEMREKVAQYLVEDITAKGDHLSTGFVGVSYLLPVLTQTGRTDMAYKLLLQDTFPSWLFSVKHGATTIWERWDGWTPERGFQDPGMNSFNHYSLGSCGEWMFSSLAGIDTEGPGFKKLIIRPTPGEGITWVKASYDSINGRIVSKWTLEGDKLTMDVTILANTTATLYLPTKDSATVTESGKPVSQVQGMKFLRMENGRALYEAGSGHYLIKCAMN